jgi:putative ABC transport system ATP-binding protein
MTLFLQLNRDLGLTVLLVTHDPTIAARCPRRIVMRDGRIENDNCGSIRPLGGT